ncbi:unnamed protein product [Closterium sp. Naga37s-1]|nr:unnamed protein product [Closterium sp. Naga37s-1]
MEVCARLYSLAVPTPPLTHNASRVEAAREEHREVEEQVRRARSRAKVLKDKLKRDYGPHGEFSNLVDRCFAFNANQYTYEICPYKKAVQKEGHSETTLGRAGRHFKRFEAEHTVMAFEDGEHCWNGPPRSIKVNTRAAMHHSLIMKESSNASLPHHEGEQQCITPLIMKESSNASLSLIMKESSNASLPHHEGEQQCITPSS